MKHDKQLLEMLNADINSVDNYDLEDIDSVAAEQRRKKLASVKGSPVFSAQFDVNVYLKFFTLTSSTYTLIAASSLNAGLKNTLPAYLFSWNDYKTGYSYLSGKVSPGSNWTLGKAGIYGRDLFTDLAFDAAVTGQLLKGDLIVPFTSALPGTGTTTLGLVIMRSPNVAMGTLLESLGKKSFEVVLTKYTVPDETSASLLQFNNSLLYSFQSFLGKDGGDKISPQSFNNPADNQKNVKDITYKYTIDDERGLALSLNYDVGSVSFSFFVIVK